MRNLDGFRNMLAVNVNSDDIKRLFEKEKIASLYQNVRNADIVKMHYQKMIEEIELIHKQNYLVKEILQDEEVIEYTERIIKTQLLNYALERIVDKPKVNLEQAVIMCITQYNVLKAIDYLEENLKETLNEFCKRIIGNIIFKTGLKFLD